MAPGLVLERIWEDVDLVEVRVSVACDRAHFVNEVYVTHDELQALVDRLQAFSVRLMDPDPCELRLGSMGPETARGGLLAWLKFQPPGLLWVRTRQQTAFEPGALGPSAFGLVADEATLQFATEPGLLDTFVAQLASLSRGTRDSALLSGLLGS